MTVRVLVWPADHDACAAYRLEMPARAVADATDWQVTYTEKGVSALWSCEWEGKMPPLAARPLALERLDADVVVMQRPTRHFWSDMIPLLQEQGIKVVVDMDDDFDAIPPNHVSHQLFDPVASPPRNRNWARLACRRADLVTVTTPALLDRYGFGHGVVLPNLIPERYLKVEPEAQMMVAGWSGSVGTHPGDLQVTGGSVARALEASPGWGFHVVGSGQGVRAALGLDEEPTNTGAQWVPFARYPDKLAELSVGIVPLEDSAFNRAKSGLKLLEMSAVGVPTVASPTPDNRRVNRLGMGVLADRPADWLKQLRALMRSADYRADLACRSREAAAGQTVEAHAERWVRAWSPTRTVQPH